MGEGGGGVTAYDIFLLKKKRRPRVNKLKKIVNKEGGGEKMRKHVLEKKGRVLLYTSKYQGKKGKNLTKSQEKTKTQKKRRGEIFTKSE